MAVNPISQRYPFELRDQPYEVVQAHRFAFQGIVDLNQAIAALKSQINSNVAATTSLTTRSGGGAIPVPFPFPYPGLGAVNNQTGATAYTTSLTDNGIFLILDDASPIAVSLDSALTTPFFLFVTNLGAGTATLTPTIGTINGLASFALATNYSSVVFYDGVNWWAETTANSMMNPMTTEGDMIYGHPGSTPDRLPIGLEGKVLTSDGTDPFWGNLPTFVYNEQVAGSGTSFTLAHVPNTDGVGNPAVALYNGSARLHPTVDYTLPSSSAAITMLYSVTAGDLWADYQHS